MVMGPNMGQALRKVVGNAMKYGHRRKIGRALRSQDRTGRWANAPIAGTPAMKIAAAIPEQPADERILRMQSIAEPAQALAGLRR